MNQNDIPDMTIPEGMVVRPIAIRAQHGHSIADDQVKLFDEKIAPEIGHESVEDIPECFHTTTADLMTGIMQGGLKPGGGDRGWRGRLFFQTSAPWVPNSKAGRAYENGRIRVVLYTPTKALTRQVR